MMTHFTLRVYQHMSAPLHTVLGVNGP